MSRQERGGASSLWDLPEVLGGVPEQTYRVPGGRSLPRDPGVPDPTSVLGWGLHPLAPSPRLCPPKP